jgi:iduronate 2-sulfatase
LFEESLRSPLIVAYPGMDQPGVPTDAVVETQDIFPTLCDLVALEKPGFATGTSLLPILKNPETTGHATVGYWGGARTLRTDRYRLIVHKSGDVELYDHAASNEETENVADQNPTVVAELKKMLETKMGNDR